VVRFVDQSSGGVRIDTRQYAATRLPNAQIEEFGEFGQGLTLAKSPPLDCAQSPPLDCCAQFTTMCVSSGFGGRRDVWFD